ncbi:protein of unknown function [Onishia taeanensis]|uniref:DUF3541 domain-containing protein n=1 Tax=Onishia taeanensis TaxID=284577 RepID=A0A1G7SAZ7_9GAMM|nr:DUF3541 domain-containing protein [Halomonas taeanensis]SDG20141.1 protein of unknown function [Halomonas taeanensis]
MRSKAFGYEAYHPVQHRLRWVLLWLLYCLVVGCATAAPLSQQDIAAEIRARYDTAFDTLPAAKQRHYAQRLYRITGDERYLPPLEDYGRRLVASLQKDIAGLAEPGYAAQRAAGMLERYPERTRKQRIRKEMLGEWGEMIFAKYLAFRLNQARAHGLLNEQQLSGVDRAMAYLDEQPYRDFLTSPEVLEVYAAQVANLAYDLYGLGVADLRHEAKAAFRAHYPPARDAALSQASFRNKIYGMTHFVIAASDYYQYRVSATDNAWILDEFDAQIERILAETKEDIYTEVGISFQLAGLADHPVVSRTQQALMSAYDPEASMIPGEFGSTDLARGEHRNVLAIMLLDGPERFYAGPDITKYGN